MSSLVYEFQHCTHQSRHTSEVTFGHFSATEKEQFPIILIPACVVCTSALELSSLQEETFGRELQGLHVGSLLAFCRWSALEMLSVTAHGL